MRNNIGIFLAFIGILLIGLAQISAIGETIYRWGALDIALGASIWEAFKTWMIMVVTGLVSLSIGVILKD